MSEDELVSLLRTWSQLYHWLPAHVREVVDRLQELTLEAIKVHQA